MESLNSKTERFNKSNLNDILYRDYVASLKDSEFKKLVNKLKISDEIGMKYTSKLEHTLSNLKNCENCKNLFECTNEVNGCVYYPKKDQDKLEFNYVTCKYKNKAIKLEKIKKSKIFGLSNDLANAKMSEIDITDQKRVEIIKFLKKFYDLYPKEKKGLYLHGSFGSGKTYLVSALFNELSKKDYNAILVYFPELLSKLKSSFENSEDNSFKEILDSVKTCDLLLIDDIGAETVTSWSRDEILGTILQYRMENSLSTFFTSNLNIDELEIHLSLTKNNVDKVKARRIIERIKQLSLDMELVSVNRRQ